MEVYWLRKDIIDKTFSDVLETAKKTFTEHKEKPDWKNYLRYLKGIGKFSMKKDVMGKHLLELCNNDDLLAGILMSGSEQLYSKDGSFLLKSTENEFCLKDKLGFGDALSRAFDMNYLALNRLSRGNFTFECVKSFEKKLLKNCWNVFQLSFLKLKVTETYLNYYESMKVNTDVNPGDEEIPADAEPAVIQGLDVAEQAVKEVHVNLPHSPEFNDVEVKEVEEEGKRKYIELIHELGFKRKYSVAEKMVEITHDEAKAIGFKGEAFAYGYYHDRFEDTYAVVLMNQGEESGLSYDIGLCDKTKVQSKESDSFIEVKSISKKNMDWFFMSKNEFELGLDKKKDYIIAHIYIDEKQKDDKLKYRVTEYSNPASEESELELYMTRA